MAKCSLISVRSMLATQVVALLQLLMLLSLPGCATVVASIGISSIDEIPFELQRAEVRERFGEPVSTDTSVAGRTVEVFHIRHKLDNYKLARTEIECWASGYCFVLWPFLLGHTVIQSEANRTHVAFVYDPEGRALYYFTVNAAPADRFVQATRSLPNPLLDANEFDKCANITSCVTAHIAETRRRADEVGHTIEGGEEKIFSVALSLAREIDDGKMTREDAAPALAQMKAASLSLASCVADYVAVVRRQATVLGYVPNAQDEEFFASELRIAQDADAGEIGKDDAYSRLLGESTRHLIRLYQNQDTAGVASRQLYDVARPLTDTLLKRIDENRCRQ